MGAIKAKVDQMGVAIYNNIRIKEMQEQLPTVEQIQERIKQAEDEFRMNVQK